jgi:hypothetical protein
MILYLPGRAPGLFPFQKRKPKSVSPAHPPSGLVCRGEFSGATWLQMDFRGWPMPPRCHIGLDAAELDQ